MRPDMDTLAEAIRAGDRCGLKCVGSDPLPSPPGGTLPQPLCGLQSTRKPLQNQAPHPGSIPGASTVTT